MEYTSQNLHSPLQTDDFSGAFFGNCGRCIYGNSIITPGYIKATKKSSNSNPSLRFFFLNDTLESRPLPISRRIHGRNIPSPGHRIRKWMC